MRTWRKLSRQSLTIWNSWRRNLFFAILSAMIFRLWLLKERSLMSLDFYLKLSLTTLFWTDPIYWSPGWKNIEVFLCLALCWTKVSLCSSVRYNYRLKDSAQDVIKNNKKSVNNSFLMIFGSEKYVVKFSMPTQIKKTFSFAVISSA